VTEGSASLASLFQIAGSGVGTKSRTEHANGSTDMPRRSMWRVGLILKGHSKEVPSLLRRSLE
jgi:hypothetical protein